MRSMTVAVAAGLTIAAGWSDGASAQYVLPDTIVAAYPTPGTIAASPRSEISFRGRTRADLGTISVTGSRSGRHRGRLVDHSDGEGVSFVPAKSFRQGESVAVRTSLPIPGSDGGDFRFRVARTPSRVEIPNLVLEPIPPGKRDRFRSRPDLRPPLVTVTPGNTATDDGFVILSPKSKTDGGQAGPMIVDNGGEPVWFQPRPGITAATDVRVQRYRGRPVITWWEGTSRQGIGVGRLVMVDESYRTIKRFQVPNGYKADLHEFLITPRDTALVISYPAVRADLSKVGGSRNGQVIDSVIQEIDIATGRVIFEWHSLGEVAIADAYSKPNPSPRVPFDYFHANSVGLDSDDDILISARNTWGIYKIDRVTGRREWTLGGKRSTFKLGKGVRFGWQHDARRRADGALTLFDNSAFPPIAKLSRALAIALDETKKTATLVSARQHPRKLLAATQGNHQSLPRGGAFVGWGSQRYFTEYDAAGKVVWDARLSVGYETYRAYRSPWVGRPATRPRVHGVRRSRDSVDVCASWNGTTETARWEILAGPSPSRLAPVTEVSKQGFETCVLVGARDRYVAGRAKSQAGAVLATSPAARVR